MNASAPAVEAVEAAAAEAASPAYESLAFEYRASPDQQAAVPAFHPVVVVGAGPVGLALAIDLAQRGVRVLLLDDDHRLSTGSRAICFAKRSLEIFDRLGVGDRLVGKGVSWKVGRVYFGADLVYSFDLLPEAGHERPAFINLQQYYVEGYLAERALALPNVELRWKNRVFGIAPAGGGVRLDVDTPDGRYSIDAGHAVACDGSKSTLRALLGLETKGRSFRDRFLIADVRIDGGADLPAERRFWFDPPFHPRRSALLHKQADGVWRIDFQLGWDADPDAARRPEAVRPMVRAMLDSVGADQLRFEIVWASVYTFACQRMERFRHGRVLFAGDAAHGVSPFGARGANSGIQDAGNLAWKLARVAAGTSPDSLLDSYAAEREAAADENIRASTRSTDFITPKSAVSRLFRDAVLALAREHAFARRLVDSGRLSVPATLHGSALNTADVDAFDGAMVPGAVAADAPLRRADGRATWLLRELGSDFTLLVFGAVPEWAAGLPLRVLGMAAAAGHNAAGPGVEAGPDGACAEGRPGADIAVGVSLVDRDGLAARRYDATPRTAYLIRPDQHVCARWRTPDAAGVRAALARARGAAP